jgi:Integrase zinc binding domain
MNISSIKISKTQKGLNVLDFSWFRLVLYDFDFGRIHLKSVGSDHMTEIVNGLRVEVTFLAICIQSVLVESVNPQNCHPVFSSTQLSASLRATAMLPVALHGIITIDIEELQKDILTAYDTDPAVQSFRADSDNSKYLRWSVDDVGFVQIDQRILVPESGDLWLCVLQSFHDHLVSRHFGVNKTLSVIQREYTWPNIREFVADYVTTSNYMLY